MTVYDGIYRMYILEKWLQDYFTGWELGSPVPPFVLSLMNGIAIHVQNFTFFTFINGDLVA